MRRISLFFVLCFGLLSCSNDQSFSTPATGTDFTSNAVKSFSYEYCALNGSVNPKVDLLVLIDNSTSTNLITKELKESIIDSIQGISQEFDYRIYIAPLLAPDAGDQFSNYPRFSGEPSGSTPLSPLSSIESIEDLTFNAPKVGGKELGFQRSIQIINKLHDTSDLNFFRKDSHDVIVVISNGDDSDGEVGLNHFASNYETRKQELLDQKLANNTQQLRFISVVPHSECKSGYQKGNIYRKMSKEIYLESGDTKQTSNGYPDSHDLCSDDFSKIFSGINSSIRPVIEKLTYHYWPVDKELKTKIESNKIQTEKLQVYRVTNSGKSINEINKSEYTYQSNYSGNLVEPSHITDINWTGDVLNLSTNAYTTAPDCLIISAPEKPKYYGYVPMAVKPKLSTVKLSINGKNILQDAVNGWQYIDFKSSLNILVESPTDTKASTIWSDFKSGYFLKLNGDAIYTDGDQIDLKFIKAPIRTK